MASRLESIPKPICARCGKTASSQVTTEGGQVLGRYCSGHAMGALREADDQTPKSGTSAPPLKGVVSQ